MLMKTDFDFPNILKDEFNIIFFHKFWLFFVSPNILKLMLCLTLFSVLVLSEETTCSDHYL